MKIAVVMGGITSEREVSLRSGEAVLNSLLRQGYDAYKIDLQKDNLVTAFLENEYDMAYLVLHGEYGEDGKVQSVLEMLGKRYTGSGATGSAVAMNKNLTKIIAESIGIRVPKTYSTIEEIDRYPVVIKPATEGSSIGLYICNNEDEVKKAKESLIGKELVVEEFVQGDELTAGVLNDESLGVLKIKAKSGVYDYNSKYTKGMSEYECPAKIDSQIYEQAMEWAKKIHTQLGLKGVTRSDFILGKNGLYFLEVNTCPGMTETSLVPKLASLKGYSFDDITKIMVESTK